jgi:hypothetical protein
MSESPYSDQADALARWSQMQALWPPALLVVGCVAHLLFAPAAQNGMLYAIAQLAVITSGLAAFAFSAILLFDALLFRLMASYEDEWKGGAAVDDILARMRLKSRENACRAGRSRRPADRSS